MFLAACGDDASPPDDEVIGGSYAPPLPCGANAVPCPIGQTCLAGMCITPCGTDMECGAGKCCAGVCIATLNDPANCGACGVACTAEQQCTNGACVALTCSTPRPAPPMIEDAGTDDAGMDTTPPPPSIGSNGCPTNEQCRMGANGSPTCMCGSGESCGEGESCSAAGSCSCGGGTACPPGSDCCGGTCANLQSDKTHCGSCGNACDGDLTCQTGSCRCSLLTDTACGDDCVNLKTDPTRCGACDTACPSGASCSNGQCKCPDGQIACGGACVSASDNAHCGDCSTQCTGEPTCKESVTGNGDFACRCANTVVELACGGVCVDSSIDGNCGACGVDCPSATTCQEDPADASKHQCLCPAQGETYCAGDDSCFDLQTNHDNCGTCGLACLAGESCVGGRCTCPNANQAYCDEDVNGQTDGVYACLAVTGIKNCGDCGVACVGASTCSAQKCACTDGTKSYCNNVCVNAQTDEANCGGCGIACPAGSTCNAGLCSCPSSDQDWCDEDATGAKDGKFACLDTSGDENNCGACGNQCGGATSECCASACKNPSTAYENDDNNCGSCGNKCPATGCGFLGLGACQCSSGTCG